MSEQDQAVETLINAIRQASQTARLSTLEELQALVAPAGNPEELLADTEAADIKMMRGSNTVYFFSDSTMTDVYALHLFRISERNPLRMVAETVRDESRLYPRPTPAYTFLGTPFNLSQGELEMVLGQLNDNPEMQDIRTVTVSNGALYLFSTDYLSIPYGEYLAEWNEVGQAENP